MTRWKYDVKYTEKFNVINVLFICLHWAFFFDCIRFENEIAIKYS